MNPRTFELLEEAERAISNVEDAILREEGPQAARPLYQIRCNLKEIRERYEKASTNQ